jgi:hypothetical protein
MRLIAREERPHPGAQLRIADGDLPTWMQMLALTGEARRWEPKRLRLRLFSAAARLVTPGEVEPGARPM